MCLLKTLPEGATQEAFFLCMCIHSFCVSFILVPPLINIKAQMARFVTIALVSLLIGAVAAQDIGALLGSFDADTCGSSPCFKEADMPAACCEADFLYTIAQVSGCAHRFPASSVNIPSHQITGCDVWFSHA